VNKTAFQYDAYYSNGFTVIYAKKRVIDNSKNSQPPTLVKNKKISKILFYQYKNHFHIVQAKLLFCTLVQ